VRRSLAHSHALHVRAPSMKGPLAPLWLIPDALLAIVGRSNPWKRARALGGLGEERRAARVDPAREARREKNGRSRPKRSSSLASKEEEEARASLLTLSKAKSQASACVGNRACLDITQMPLASQASQPARESLISPLAAAKFITCTTSTGREKNAFCPFMEVFFQGEKKLLLSNGQLSLSLPFPHLNLGAKS